MSRRTSRTPKKKKMSYLDDDESEEDFSPSCSSSQGSILSDDGDEDEDFEENFTPKKSKKSPKKAVGKKRKADSLPSATKATPKKTPATMKSKSSKASPSPRKTVNKNADITNNKKISGVVEPETSGSAINNGWKGPPVASEAAARKLILQYMKSQNRPYSVIQVYDNLHHRVSKAVVQRALDTLSSGDGLAYKDYGKARIYFPDQSLLETNFTTDDLNQLDDEASRLEGVLKSLQQEEAQLRSQSRTLEGELTDKELDITLAAELAKAEELRQRLDAVKGESKRKVTPQDFANATASHKKYRNAWRDRKTKARDLIEMMADGMEKPVKYVTDIVGIERDEDCDVTLPPAITS